MSNPGASTRLSRPSRRRDKHFCRDACGLSDRSFVILQRAATHGLHEAIWCDVEVREVRIERRNIDGEESSAGFPSKAPKWLAVGWGRDKINGDRYPILVVNAPP